MSTSNSLLTNKTEFMMLSKQNTLSDLQLRQLSHDKIYRPDIYSLPPQHKLKSYALLYAKYAGRILEAGTNNDVDLFKLTMIDAFIITLACANLGGNTPTCDLGNGEVFHADDTSLAELVSLIDIPEEDRYGFFNTGKLNDMKCFQETLYLMVEATGKIASAAEKSDGLESQAVIKEVVKDKVSIMFYICLRAFSFLDRSDPTEYILERWEAVERQSAFYDFFNKKAPPADSEE